jgi:hypothetical protein
LRLRLRSGDNGRVSGEPVITIPCNNCGQQVRVEAQSCCHCGTVLPCTHCGKTHGAEGGREALPWFGMHLLDRGVISAEALLKALDLQQKLQEPFGAVALRLRLMDSRQVMHLINAQR